MEVKKLRWTFALGLGLVLAGVILDLGNFILLRHLVVAEIVPVNCSQVKMTSPSASSLLRSLLHPREILFKDVTAICFVGSLKTELRIAQVKLEVSYRSLMTRPIKISRALFENPEAIVAETIKPGMPRPQITGFGAQLLKFGTIEVRQARLLYLPYNQGPMGRIHIEGLSGFIENQTGPVDPKGAAAQASTTELEKSSTRLHAAFTGRLESSALMQLRIDLSPFNSPQQAALDVRLRNLNLASLTPFFMQQEGVGLAGDLGFMQAQVTVQNHQLDARVRTRYNHLYVRFVPTREKRAPAAPFFTKLAAKLAASAKPGKAKAKGFAPGQDASLALSQEPNENLVDFIWRGLQEGILQSASN